VNADAFLPAGGGREALEAGYDVWRRVTAVDHETQAVVLNTDRGPQPYPMPLDGITSHPKASLVEAIAACATPDRTQGDSTASLAIGPELFERLSDAAAQAERRVVRLTAELDGRADADAARALGDLILARYQDILPGAESVTLTDFEGQMVEVDLDPKLPPHENASAFYDRAARSERAAARMPAIIAKAAGERDRLLALVERMNAGQATPDEIRDVLPPAPARQRRGQQTPARPYRSFRSSGGLEIRVGRGARHNDDLTFRHSAPDDVWLHARHTAGAHVILRWSGSDAPPARDLEEAGVLAALYSKARTSSSVPIDWTRRKHVRKPRGSAPGSVLPDRVKTIFVRPDERLLESLSEET
jgi:predicted ribosome quality control (RQC) complex YloA/Tae2 family protein